MTAAGSGKHAGTETAAGLPRRFIFNVTGAAWLLFRDPRAGVRPQWWNAGRIGVALAVAAAAFALAMALIDIHEMAFHRLMSHGVLATFAWISDTGKSHWFLVPTGLGLVAIAALASPALGRTTYRVIVSVAVRLGFVFMAIAVPSLVVTVVKRLIGRARPPLYFNTTPYDFFPFSWRVEYASLPSGHATTAFAVAVAVGALYPRARVWLWTYAGLVALSRLVLAAHYPSDVLAGAVVGTAGALAVRAWFASRRLGFAVAPDGGILALAGPSLHRIKRVARRLAGP